MKSYYQSAVIISLIISSLILLQTLLLTIFATLYFSGVMPSGQLAIHGSKIGVAIVILFLIILSMPGLFAFRLRKLENKNYALWIQGGLLCLAIPLLPFTANAPIPLFLTLFFLAAAGFWILHVLIHGTNWKHES